MDFTAVTPGRLASVSLFAAAPQDDPTVCAGIRASPETATRKGEYALKLKRPLGTAGFVVLASLAALRFSLFLPLFAASLILLLLLSLKKRRLDGFTAFCLCVALLFFGWYSLYSALDSRRIDRFDGQTVYVSGFICELPERCDGGACYTVRAREITVGGKTLRCSLKGTLWLDDSFSPDIYDSLGFSATAYRIDDSYSSDGLRLGFSLGDAPGFTGRARRTPYYYCLRFKQYLLSNLAAEGGAERFSLLTALLLGDKSGLSAETQLAFRRCGITHLLVVSGLHIVTLAMFCFALLRRLMRKNRYAPTLITLSLIWFFTAMTAFSPSAVRAAIMCSLMLLGTLLGREGDPLNSLGAAAGIMCVCNPAIIYSVGFLLSFSATLGLVVLAPKLYVFFKRLFRVSPATVQPYRSILCGLSLSLAQSISAWLLTLPVIFAVFKNISLLTPISNLLTVAPAMTALLLAFPAALLPHIGPLFLRLAAVVSDWLIWISARIAAIPFAYIYAGYAFVGLTLLFAGGLLVLACLGRLRRGLALSLTTCVLFCGAFSSLTVRDGRIRVTAVYQTGGQAEFISKDGAVLLYISDIASVGCSAILSAARLRGITSVNALIVGDRCSSDAAATLADAFGADRVLLPVSARDAEYPDGCECAVVSGGSISAFPGASVTVSGDSRLSLYIVYGCTTLVFTGESELRRPYNTVFASGSFTPCAHSGLLVTPRTGYASIPDGFTVVATAQEDVVTFACDGEGVYAL